MAQIVLGGLAMSQNRQTLKHQERATLWSIETLRMYAVIGVVLYHSVDASVRMTVTHSTNPMGGVRLGLDLFFVLSGFLVWMLTRTRETKPLLFFWHRVTRLGPMYWVATILFAGFLAITGWDLVYKPVSFSAGDLIFSLLFIPHWDAARNIAPVLAPGWTLAYDVWYFALFALVLAAPRKHQLLAASCVFSAVVLAHLLRWDNPIAQVCTHPRALDFLAGIWIAEAFERRIILPRRLAQTLSIGSGLATVGLVCFALSDKGWSSLLWMACAWISTYSLTSIEATGRPWGRLPFAERVGAWSYAIYLVQPISISAAAMLVPGGFAIKLAACLAVSIALGAAGHLWTEAPVNRRLKRWERGRNVRAVAAVTVAP